MSASLRIMSSCIPTRSSPERGTTAARGTHCCTVTFAVHRRVRELCWAAFGDDVRDTLADAIGFFCGVELTEVAGVGEPLAVFSACGAGVVVAAFALARRKGDGGAEL